MDQLEVLLSVYPELSCDKAEFGYVIKIPLGSLVETRIGGTLNLCPNFKKSLTAVLILGETIVRAAVLWKVPSLIADGSFQTNILFSSDFEEFPLCDSAGNDHCIAHITIDLEENDIKILSETYQSLAADCETFPCEYIEFLLDFFSNRVHYFQEEQEEEHSIVNQVERTETIALLPPPFPGQILVGEPVIDRKSTFVARCARVYSNHDVDLFIQSLLTEPKIAQASHNITAYRVKRKVNDFFVMDQGCDDDGEKAAGSRLLYLLQLLKAENVVVLVSRYYGGVKLGPDRFKRILDSAKQVLLIMEQNKVD